MDRGLEPTVEARRKVAAEIRRYRPEVVLTLNPAVRWTSRGTVNHPDHRAAGDLALHSHQPGGVQPSLGHHAARGGPGAVGRQRTVARGFGPGPHHVEITDTFDAKMAALRRHATQLRDWDPEERMRAMAAERGKEVGAHLTEAIAVLRFRDLEE